MISCRILPRPVGPSALVAAVLLALIVALTGATTLSGSAANAAAAGASVDDATATRAGKPPLVKLGNHPVRNAREARRHLRATPSSYRRFVVAELRRTQRRSCAPGETRTGSITTAWYHRRGFAIGSVEACTVGYGVVWRKVKRRWRAAVVFQSAAECSQLRRQRVPRNLWRKGFGPMCATRSGYVTYTGPR